MDVSNLNTWAVVSQIIAAAGVIGSVVYLGIQVHGSTNALRTQTHHNLLMAAQRPMELTIADSELAAIVQAGLVEPGRLSEADWYRFSMYQVIAFNAWEYGYYLNRSGSTPPELWEGVDAYYRELVRSQPGLRRFWAEYEHIFAEPFHTYAAERFPAFAAGAESR